MRYCNYHQHTGYSFLDGMAKPADLVARCKELGFGYCMVTDHGNVAGSAAVYKECKKQGIIPLLGTELYLKDEEYDNDKAKGWHLLLWALNTEGLKNIWTISSQTYMQTTYDHKTPNTTWDILEGHGKGVVCSSACLASLLADAAKNNDEEEADYFVGKCRSIFDEFAIEIHCNHEVGQDKVNLWLANYAKKNNLRLVYSVDAHYVTKEDAALHDVWMGLNRAHSGENYHKYPHEYFVKSPEEIRADLNYLGEETVNKCFEGVDDLLGKVEEIDLDGTHKLAAVPLPEGYTDSDRYLRDLAFGNLYERTVGVRPVFSESGISIPQIPEDKVGELSILQKRLIEELDLVLDNGLADYFLMVSEYARWAKNSGILLGPGRGSGAGSLLCYLLDITSINPLEHDLMFSRFINQGRLGTYIVTWDDGSTSEFGEKVKVEVEGKGKTLISNVGFGDVVDGRYRSVVEQLIESEPRTVKEIVFRGGELPDIDLDFEGMRRSEVEDHLKDVYGEEHVTAVGTTTFYGISLALQDVCRFYKVPLNQTNVITRAMRELEEMAGKEGNWRDYMDRIRPDDAKLIKEIDAKFPSLFPQAEAIVGLPRQQGKHAAGYVISPEPLAESLPVRKAFPDKHQSDVISQFDKYEVESLGFVKIDLLGLRNLDTLALAIKSVEQRTGVHIDLYKLKDDPDDPLWDTLGSGDTFSIFQLEGKGVTDVVKSLKPRSIDDLATIQALYRPGVIGAGMLDEYIRRATGAAPVSYLHPMLKPILEETYGIMVFQEQTMKVFTELAGFTDAEADQIRAAIGHKNKEQMDAMRPRWNDGCLANGINIETADRIWDQIQASASYSFNNSHAVCYSTISYWTAWMRQHYPVDYYAACLSTVGDLKTPGYVNRARKDGVKVSPPTVKTPSRDYQVLSDKEIAMGLINVKGLGEKTIQKIVDSAPYTDFYDFCVRSGANKANIESLIKGNFFRELEPNSFKLLLEYQTRKNPSQDELFSTRGSNFDSRWYSESEIIENERNVYGVSLTYDEWESYRKGLPEVSDVAMRAGMNDQDSALVLGRITQTRAHTDKNGNVMCFVSFETDENEDMEATAFSVLWSKVSNDMTVGSVYLLDLVKGTYKGNASWTMRNVRKLNRED